MIGIVIALPNEAVHKFKTAFNFLRSAFSFP